MDIQFWVVQFWFLRGGGDVGDCGVEERRRKKSGKNREMEREGKMVRVVWLLKMIEG